MSVTVDEVLTLQVGIYRNGKSTVRAVQLTEANGRAVWAWADSKTLVGPDGSVYGLRIFSPGGDQFARFGDWVVQCPLNAFWAVTDRKFAADYEPIGKSESVEARP